MVCYVLCVRFAGCCNKYHLFHLVGILFPHNNADARSKSLQMKTIVYRECSENLKSHAFNCISLCRRGTEVEKRWNDRAKGLSMSCHLC